MTVTETPLKDCVLIEHKSFGDDRGFFMESFNLERFKNESGMDFEVRQVNFAESSKNVLRGLHYQDKPFAQAKLVGVTRGAVMDVIVDIRKDSPTYLQHYSVVLDRPTVQLYVPRGFAHGYKALEDHSLFYYFVDEFYAPDHEKGLLYSDEVLSIDWQLSNTPIVSEKDLAQPLAKDMQNKF